MRRIAAVLSVTILSLLLPAVVAPSADAAVSFVPPGIPPVILPAGAATVTIGGSAAPATATALLGVGAGVVAGASAVTALGAYAIGRYALGPAMCRGGVGGLTDFLLPGTGGAEPCNPYLPPEWTSPDFSWAYSDNRAVLSWDALNWPDTPPALAAPFIVGPADSWRAMVELPSGDTRKGCFGVGPGAFTASYISCGQSSVPAGSYYSFSPTGPAWVATQTFDKFTSNGPFMPEDRIAFMPATCGYFCRTLEPVLAGADTAVGGWAPAPDFVRSRGRSVGFRVTSDCVPVASPTGTSVERVVTGDLAFEGASDARVPPVPCLEAEISRRTEIQKIGPNRAGVAVNLGPAVVTELDVSKDYAECFSQSSGCLDPEVKRKTNGSDTCEWGGHTVALAACTNPKTSVESPVWSEGEPQPDPDSVETPPTTVPNHDVSDDNAPVVPGLPDSPDDPGGGGRFDSCVADLTEGALDGVSYNPVTWVRALLWYVWVPIFCAVWWLVVPADGWGSIWTRLRDIWTEHPALEPFRFAIGQFELTSSCLPVDLRNDFSQAPVLQFEAGMCGNLILAAVWGVLLGLGVLGMSADFLETVATFRKKTRSKD